MAFRTDEARGVSAIESPNSTDPRAFSPGPDAGPPAIRGSPTLQTRVGAGENTRLTQGVPQMPMRRQLANAIRALSMDAVQKANSGHPGMPMGMADIAQVLWGDHLRHNPGNPQWADRDRFVVSNGHGSMLLYALLNLTGYPLSIDDIKAFRQLGSHTAGHPEHEPHLGIETTTGPLG